MDECDFDLLVILRETNHFIRNKKNNVCIPLYIFFYDGQQQFHQYQQNNQLPLTSTHQIRTMTYGAGNLDPGLGQVLRPTH
jgi:hypothetical protein